MVTAHYSGAASKNYALIPVMTVVVTMMVVGVIGVQMTVMVIAIVMMVIVTIVMITKLRLEPHCRLRLRQLRPMLQRSSLRFAWSLLLVGLCNAQVVG